jgi:transposase
MDLRGSTTSERIDALPLVMQQLRAMQVDKLIDQVLGPVHGNWQGLSRGQVALVFLSYVVLSESHFLSPLEDWIAEHQHSLSQALGQPVRTADGTDDRLAVLLSDLGDETAQRGYQLEQALGQHLIRAYALPTDVARIDMTTVSVYHRPASADGLLRFGHSKDHRPDLRQFKEALGTLDPAGLPLASATLSGEQADDPNYLPVWERLVATIGRPDFLLVADCKLACLANRAYLQAHGGFFLAPLPLSGPTPADLRQWLAQPPTPLVPICLADQAANAAPIGQGFSVTVECQWTDPVSRARQTWSERRLVVQSTAYAQQQRLEFQTRLAQTEQALAVLNRQPCHTQTRLAERAQAVLARQAMGAYLVLTFHDQLTQQTGYVGQGRPGPNRARRTVDIHTWTVQSQRQLAALAQVDTLAGWRVYATNTSAQRLSLSQAVNCYRQQWQPEHAFQRLKGGQLAITPLFLHDEARIRGLLVLLGVALRLLTLTEFCLRRELAKTGQALAGLYDGNPRRATGQPTTERLLKAFDPITLYRHKTPAEVWFEVTPLSALQTHILRALGVPLSIYDPPTTDLIESG